MSEKVKFLGDVEVAGGLTGIADCAIGDEDGNNIRETYATISKVDYAQKDAAYEGYYWAIKDLVDLGAVENVEVVPYGTTDISMINDTARQLVIPSTVETISGGGYGGQLEKVIIPRNVKTITGQGLCYYLWGSDTERALVKILGGVTSIEGLAFRECQYLDIDLTAYGENTPFPTLGGRLTGDDVGTPGSFDVYLATFRIYVPKGRKAELASMTNWADCASVIMEV